MESFKFHKNLFMVADWNVEKKKSNVEYFLRERFFPYWFIVAG